LEIRFEPDAEHSGCAGGGDRFSERVIMDKIFRISLRAFSTIGILPPITVIFAILFFAGSAHATEYIWNH